MPGHKRNRDQEDAAAAVRAAGSAGAVDAAAAATGAAGAEADAARTKKQKTAAALAAAEAVGISTKVNYGTDEQQQAHEDARRLSRLHNDALVSFKIRAGKLLERFEQAFPHVENLRAHLQNLERPSNLGESESLDKSFKVLHKFFHRGKDDTAHCAASFYAQETANLEYARIVILEGEKPWAPAIQEMHRSRIQAAKARAAEWAVAHSDEETEELDQNANDI